MFKSLTLLFFIACAPVWAQQVPDSRELVQEQRTYYVTTNRLNLRSSDELGNHNILGVLNTGDAVRVIDSSTNFNGDFVRIEVLETNSTLRSSDRAFISFKFLTACPMDWRQILCSSDSEFKKVLTAERVEKLGEHSFRFINPGLYDGLNHYQIDHQSYPQDACERLGFQELEQATIRTRETTQTRTAVIIDSGPASFRPRGYAATSLTCTQARGRTASRGRDNLLVIRSGELHRPYFEAQGFRVILGR